MREKEEEVESETAFLKGVVISWPSSCFTAGTSFVLQRAGTNTHPHTPSHICIGGGGTAAKAMPMYQP